MVTFFEEIDKLFIRLILLRQSMQIQLQLSVLFFEESLFGVRHDLKAQPAVPDEGREVYWLVHGE